MSSNSVPSFLPDPVAGWRAALDNLSPHASHCRYLVPTKWAAIRKGLELTQAAFAARYGFPIGTLRGLEQGRVRPDASTRAYLVVISREPEAVQRPLAPAA